MHKRENPHQLIRYRRCIAVFFSLYGSLFGHINAFIDVVGTLVVLPRPRSDSQATALGPLGGYRMTQGAVHPASATSRPPSNLPANPKRSVTGFCVGTDTKLTPPSDLGARILSAKNS